MVISPQGTSVQSTTNGPPPLPPRTPPGVLLRDRRQEHRPPPPGPATCCSTCIRDLYHTEGITQEQPVLPTGGDPNISGTVIKRKDTKIHVFLPSTSLDLSLTSLDDEVMTSQEEQEQEQEQEEEEDKEELRPKRTHVTRKASRYCSSNSRSSSTHSSSSSSKTPVPVHMRNKNYDADTSDKTGDSTKTYETTPTLLSHASPSDLALLRDLSLRVGPRWRDVASGLGLQGSEVESLVRANPMSKGSELAYRTLSIWWRRTHVGDAKMVLQKVFKDKKLLAAEGRYYIMGPLMGRGGGNVACPF